MKFWRKPFNIDAIKIPRGDIHIIHERCKGCSFCVEYCPKDVLEMSEEFTAHGYHPPRVVKPDDCVECHLCEMLCPEFAIFVTVREDEPVTDSVIGMSEQKR